MNTDLLGFLLSLSLSLSPMPVGLHVLMQTLLSHASKRNYYKLKEDYVELMHVDYMTIV